jgi:hypothetical protein
MITRGNCGDIFPFSDLAFVHFLISRTPRKSWSFIAWECFEKKAPSMGNYNTEGAYSV